MATSDAAEEPKGLVARVRERVTGIAEKVSALPPVVTFQKVMET